MKKLVVFICFLIIIVLIHFLSDKIFLVTKGNEELFDYTKSSEYSFLVAGHAYGSHHDVNKGLYPKFMSKVKNEIIDKDNFIIFTGDIVRNSTSESWEIVESQLKEISLPSFLVMGNHDFSESGINFFNEKHGNTFYFFKKNNDLFFSFNVNLSWGNITQDQLSLFKETIKNNFDSNNVFVFFHELIWTQGKLKYLHIQHNFQTYPFKSNFWTDLFPVFQSFPNRQFYLIAGDLGGTPNSISAFFDKIHNVTFLASGMGETKRENFMRITVQRNTIDVNLIPLNNDISLGHINDYSNWHHFLEMFLNKREYLFLLYKKAFLNILIKDNSS